MAATPTGMLMALKDGVSPEEALSKLLINKKKPQLCAIISILVSAITVG
jgi:hypothetical protein